MKMRSRDCEQAVVFDLGAHTCTIGWAGDDSPVLGAVESVNPATDAKTPLYAPESPILTDFDGLGHLFNSSLANLVKIREQSTKSLQEQAAEICVLVATPPLPQLLGSRVQARRYVDRLDEVLFEQCGVAGVSYQPSPCLSLYSAGRTTGLVACVGASSVSIGANYEGYSEENLYRATTAMNDRNVVQKWTSLMFPAEAAQQQSRLSSTALRAVHDARKTFSIVPAHRQQTSCAESDDSCNAVKLPDGEVISVEARRFVEDEYFSRDDPTRNVAAQIFNVLRDAPIDIRRELAANILLSESPTMTSGFSERTENELVLAFEQLPMKPVSERTPYGGRMHSSQAFRVVAPPERSISTWIGGSIWASLSVTAELWMDRSEF